MKKTLYTGKTLFTANSAGEMIRDFALLVEDGRIRWVGKKAEMDETSEMEQVDLGDAFVMPGLIDAHVHLIGGSGGEDIPAHACENRRVSAMICRGAANAKALLKAGVVACRDLGSVGGYALGLRDSVDAGELAGPRVQACGYAICATGGHGYGISYEADGKDAVTRCVRQVVKDGADVVKLMVSGGVNSPGPEPGPCELSMDEIQSGVDAAHAPGRKVAVHTHGNTAIRRCVEAGVDSIEHGVFMSEDIMEMMKERGAFFVPTLSAPYHAVNEGLRRDPDNPDHQKSGEVIERHGQY
ncbi:MAG: amidohydrolase family protein [Eubacteriales bacterium]